MFTINDPQAIGSDLAAKQLGRSELIITSVDGAPDIEAALKPATPMVQASASQDPYAMAQTAVAIGYDIMNGKKPADPMILMPSTLITTRQCQGLQGLVRAALTPDGAARNRRAAPPRQDPGCSERPAPWPRSSASAIF